MESPLPNEVPGAHAVPSRSRPQSSAYVRLHPGAYQPSDTARNRVWESPKECVRACERQREKKRLQKEASRSAEAPCFCNQALQSMKWPCLSTKERCISTKERCICADKVMVCKAYIAAQKQHKSEMSQSMSQPTSQSWYFLPLRSVCFC